MPRKAQPKIGQPSVARIIDFSGGKNSTISPALLNDNEAVTADNISYEQKGTLTPLRGRKKRYDAEFSADPCTGIGAYYKKDGTSRLVVASGAGLFSDEPHIESKYTSQADWESGTVGDRVSTTGSPGDLVLKVGATAAIATSTGENTGGTKGYTYGWTFTPTKDIRMYGFRLYGVLADKKYNLRLWKESDKSVVKAMLGVVPTKTDGWTEVNFYDSPVELVSGTKYMVGVYHADTDNFIKYWTGGTASPEVTYGEAWQKQADAYPDAANTNKFFGVDIKYDVVDYAQTYTANKTMALTGVDNTVQDDVATGTLTEVYVDNNGELKLDNDLTWTPYTASTWASL